MKCQGCILGDCDPRPDEGCILHFDGFEWTCEVTDADLFAETYCGDSPENVATNYAEGLDEYHQELAAEYRAEQGGES